MAAIFHQRTLNQNTVPALGSKTILAKWYECDPGDLTILNVGATNANSWSSYGTNASFFIPSGSSAGTMVALHIADNAVVRTGGNTNCASQGDTSTAMDYIGYVQVPYTPYLLFLGQRVPSWTQSSNVYFKWAVGGFNMLVGGNYNTSNELAQAHTTYYGGNSAMVNTWIPQYTVGRPRTFIGYNSNNKVLFGVLYNTTGGPPYQSAGLTVFEVHKVLKYLNLADGLLLDGSGSTQVRYKQNNIDTSMNGDGRAVYCMLALSTTAANNCNWNGT